LRDDHLTGAWEPFLNRGVKAKSQVHHVTCVDFHPTPPSKIMLIVNALSRGMDLDANDKCTCY